MLDIKGAFNYINRKRLLELLIELKLLGNILAQVASFLTNRQVCLVVDRIEGPLEDIQVGLLQDSLVLPILFIIYISKLLKELEEKFLTTTIPFFVDNIYLLVTRSSIQEVALALKEIGDSAINLGKEYKIKFKIGKIEVVLMSRKRDTQKKAKEFSINLASSPITFNKDATHQLGFQLDYRLDFLKYFNKKIA